VTVDALVHGLIVQSGNDAALALAELVGGSEANFVAMMNDTAKRLGMAHTHFADTNGLPHAQHYTTAADLALLSMRLIQDFPEYYSLFAVKEYTYNRIRQSNRNRLLWIDSSVDGLKTGHTEAAGFCLVASAKRPLANTPNQNRRLVSVVMGERKESDRVQDSLKMLNYGFQAYDGVPLYKAGQVLNISRIYKGKLNQLKVGIATDVMVSVPRGSSDKIKTTLSMSTPLIAPIAKGQALGTVQVQVDGKPITTLPVVALEAVPESNIVGRAWDSLLLKIQKIWDKRK
jgi:D-alanyl-D-alanine carboxypeptidase (penicillin-binding protein 5/6)